MTDGLLRALQRRANSRGLVLVRDVALLEELSVTGSELQQMLAKLERDRAIELISPPPFVALRLRVWRGKQENERNSSYSAIQQLLPIQRVNSSYRHGGAFGPIDQALLKEILDTLDESDAKGFEKAVELYSPHVIRKALGRVRRAKGIRKNRTALFRHLLPRLARDEHRFDHLA